LLVARRHGNRAAELSFFAVHRMLLIWQRNLAKYAISPFI
jgi:hypothetical protein